VKVKENHLPSAQSI